jgi:endothelin-converting enzyme/putative endopeptidase
MRRTLLLGSSLVFALAVACGASQSAAPVAPPPPAPPVVVAPAPAAPHAPAPPPPPGVEIASIDPGVSPCDDFFHYACGNWIKANPIPDDQGRWTRFNALGEQNEMVLRDILEKDAAARGKPAKLELVDVTSKDRKAQGAKLVAAKGPGARGADDGYSRALGDFYASCMDEEGIEKNGLQPIRQLLHDIDAVSDAAGLARVVADMHLAGAKAFFDVESEQDAKDATEMVARIDQGGLGMPDRDYYLTTDDKTVHVRAAYLAHVQRVFELLGDPHPTAQIEAASVLALEKGLATSQMSRVDRRDPEKVYHRMDRAGVAQTAPGFAWDAYWKQLGVPGITTFNLAVPAYFTATFGPQASAAGDVGRFRPYLRWQVARAFAQMLPKRFVDESFSFEKEKTGAAKILPRWKRCVHAVNRGMGEALAIPFVAAKLGPEGKEVTQGMVRRIELAMQADLDTLAWMDAPTRARALEKVHKLLNKIGYPEKWRNYDSLAARIQRGSYASNVAEADRFELRRQLAQVGKPVDRAEWHMTPPTVNAYYNPSMNEMVFPAGILQPPFYTKDVPTAVNFGGLGMVMGHELTHGFDDEGRKFDGDGNLKEWWTAAVGADFEKRAACVADQFNGYTAVDDLHVNGKLTLGENLADLGGAKLALSVVRSIGSPSEEADRQFFLGAAQVWCGAMRPEEQRVRVRVDPHSPPMWRVNGPVSNMPEFAQAFGCRAGDPMVRPEEKRCTVW